MSRQNPLPALKTPFPTQAAQSSYSRSQEALFSYLPATVRPIVEELVKLQLVSAPQLKDLFARYADRIGELTTREKFGNALVGANLLTAYQLGRIMAGQTHGLVLGNYRVLERIGSGTVGVVFLGQHAMLHRRVAIKVIPSDESFSPDILERFHSEMRVLAHLDHPHIVVAYDGGVVNPPESGLPPLHYLVMEHVAGGDLENYVYKINAPLPIAQGCEWMRQAAAGLQEAHDHHLIHRDLKPSNLLLTADQQVKLVDFGLAKQFSSTLTKRGSLLGSLEFMAPEQSLDPTAVAGPADIYGLGATMFWLLTGQTPFPVTQSLVDMMRNLQNGRPRRMREFRPEIPQELDELVNRMMARDPDQRPALPITVMNALSKFASPSGRSSAHTIDIGSTQEVTDSEPWRVLIADRDQKMRSVIFDYLATLGCQCFEPSASIDPIAQIQRDSIDLAIVEHQPPHADGLELCRQIRRRSALANMKIVLLSPAVTSCQLAEAMGTGADELLPHSADGVQIATKVQHLLRLKDAQDQVAQLAQHLMGANRQLEDSLQSRANDVRRAQDAFLYGMAKLAESREGETAGHTRRLQQYCVVLAECLKKVPLWSGIIDKTFIEYLERCVPLHDIGKLGLPDELWNKPAALAVHERELIEKHSAIGDSILEAIGREYGDSLMFLGMARAIVRHHHERFDGHGYPDRLGGETIPHAARIVAIADVYDALRRKRAHKPAMPHTDAVKTIVQMSPGQFDPTVVQAFTKCHEQFDRIYQSIAN